MAEYSTEQKKLLFDFLSKNSETAYTIDDLLKHLTDEHGKRAPGKSTLYRLVTRFVKEGKIRKYTSNDCRPATYQIISSDSCHSHLHLRCSQCGRLLHLSHSLSDELIGRIMTNSNFSVNEDETILLGRCAYCKQS